MTNKPLFLILALSIILSCGGEDDGGGGSHISIQINSYDSTAAIVYYADVNCSSVQGTHMVGIIQEQCGDAFVVDPINTCTAYEMSFSQFGDAQDVEGVAFSGNRPFQVVNECDGIISGTLDGESGSCLLTQHAEAPVCRCEVNTTVVPTTENEAFATEVTENIVLLREILEDARLEIFEGLADEENAMWDERNGPTFIFPCSLF